MTQPNRRNHAIIAYIWDMKHSYIPIYRSATSNNICETTSMLIHSHSLSTTNHHPYGLVVEELGDTSACCFPFAAGNGPRTPSGLRSHSPCTKMVSLFTVGYGPELCRAALDSVEPAPNQEMPSPGGRISGMTSHKNCCGWPSGPGCGIPSTS